MIRQHTKLICLLAAVALAFGFLGMRGQRLEAQNQAKAAKTAVAVVNVAELIANSKQNQDFQAEVQKRDAKFQQETQERRDAIKQMQEDLKLAGDDERSKLISQITKALYEFEAWQKIEQQNLLRDQRTELIELYGKIDAAVSVIAKDEGYNLVLLDTPTPEFDRLNADQLIQVIGSRRVVYRSEKVNITKIVLEKLNFDYGQRGGGE